MEVLTSRFHMFKDIFPKYDDFKEWYLDCGLSENKDDVPNKITFTLIANEFNDSHSCFSDESFKQRMANILYTSYKEFEGTTKTIKDLMLLTESEIALSDQIITNVANIPENESSTNTEEVDFVSTQQKQINKKGKLQVKKELISNNRIYTVKTFLNRFRPLFIRIISPSFLSVFSEEDDL